MEYFAEMSIACLMLRPYQAHRQHSVIYHTLTTQSLQILGPVILLKLFSLPLYP